MCDKLLHSKSFKTQLWENKKSKKKKSKTSNETY